MNKQGINNIRAVVDNEINGNTVMFFCRFLWTVSVLSVSEFLAAVPEVPGSILGASTFSEKQRVWNGVHSAS
jgi:hypothetical protein